MSETSNRACALVFVAETSAPTSMRRAVTMPSNGARMFLKILHRLDPIDVRLRRDDLRPLCRRVPDLFVDGLLRDRIARRAAPSIDPR